MTTSQAYEDEDYFVPLEDQRVFGAGIRKKGVQFVRSSEYELGTTSSSVNHEPSNNSSAGGDIANAYLSIVLPKNQEEERVQQSEDKDEITANTKTTNRLCQICNLPVNNPDPNTNAHHETSIAHQVCLAHSHPPSHVDRTRHGFRYLSSFGWDPDSRVGLGPQGREGIREPVKAKVKHDMVGLGLSVEEDDDIPVSKRKKREEKEKRPAKPEKLNAKQVRNAHFEARKKGDRLKEAFFLNDDVQKHLGNAV